MASTTINWNLTAQTYVHTLLGDDFNGTGSKDRPFKSLYRACVKGGSIAVIGKVSEMIPSVNDNLAIYADSFGAAWFDGCRLTGMGGAVNNHAGVAGSDTDGYHIYCKQIVNFMYFRSSVPVGFVGVGSNNFGGANVGGGSLLVDSFAIYGTGSGNNCAFIYPKFNANSNSNMQRWNSGGSSYNYLNNQTFVGVRAWKRDVIATTREFCVFDDCEFDMIYNNKFVVTLKNCAFRKCTFKIPAALSNDNQDHQITSAQIEAATGSSHTAIINAWLTQYCTTNANYLPNVFDNCVMLKDSDPLFNDLNCVWRDATSGQIVSAANSSNAYIDPDLSSFDISIAQNSPAVPYLSGYQKNWRGTPALNYKMAAASDLLVNENASGDIMLSGNLKFETDAQSGQPFVTWDKDFDDPTILDSFKGGILTTRPRLIPSSQLFKYPKISGRWCNCLLGEKSRGAGLLNRHIYLTQSTVAFDSGIPVSLDADRLWLKDSPAANEVTAGYRYILKSGSILLYNSSNMIWIEYTEGAVISTIAGDTYFMKLLYDGAEHTVQTAELIECVPNNVNEYDAANRIEIRLFNSAADANEYNSDPTKAEQLWIPIMLITDEISGIHYYDLPQNDIVFDAVKGYMILQNPYINETTQTLAVHQQNSSIRFDSYNGDDVASKEQGVYTKTQTKNRARYGFSPLNNTSIYVQLRVKAIPFLYTIQINQQSNE